jgi:hypothetical protein
LTPLFGGSINELVRDKFNGGERLQWFKVLERLKPPVDELVGKVKFFGLKGGLGPLEPLKALKPLDPDSAFQTFAVASAETASSTALQTKIQTSKNNTREAPFSQRKLKWHP